MKVQHAAEVALADGFAAIEKQYGLSEQFPPQVLDAAELAIDANLDPASSVRVDATALPYRTLDPASSTDLDQAFFLYEDADEIVLSYALADLTSFVAHGGLVEAEAWRRGVTIYGYHKIPLYPPAISQRAASLLPDGPRPAVQINVSINRNGDLRLRSVQRIKCASRVKLAYSTVDLEAIPYLEPFAQRMWLNESHRGSVRFEFPQQEVVADKAAPSGVRLELRSPLYSEIVNSSLSLAVNMALGELMAKSHVGLFRVMDEPASRAMERLRREAHALQIPWADGESIKDVQRRLDPTNLVHQRFLLTVRRAGGRVGYACYAPDKLPWHAAIGAAYVHATAPMRRLADRYVLDLACLLAKNDAIPNELLANLNALPDVMATGEGRAKAVERAVVDLIEVVSLQDRIGEVLEAEVVDAEHGIVQTHDSAIRSRATNLSGASNGDLVRVRIDKADVARRQIVLTAVPDAGQGANLARVSE